MIALTRSILASALPRNEKLLALGLTSFANRDGRSIYPSVDRLAWTVSMSSDTTTRLLTRLVSRGVLVAETPRTGGRGRTTRYRLAVDALPQRPDYRRTKPPNTAGVSEPRSPAKTRTNPGRQSRKPRQEPHEYPGRNQVGSVHVPDHRPVHVPGAPVGAGDDSGTRRISVREANALYARSGSNLKQSDYLRELGVDVDESLEDVVL